MNLHLEKGKIEEVIQKVNFDKCGGLLPTIVQDNSTDRILMLAFMNRESLILTLETGKAHYWSRTRKKIWMKGEESGHVQLVQGAFVDCDHDTLLLRVQQKGVCCHTGEKTCFFNNIASGIPSRLDGRVLDRIFEVVKYQIGEKSPRSYTSNLASQGEEKILEKVSEESAELVLASKQGSQREVVHEASDLIAHLLILFAQKGIDFSSVYEELDKRHKEKEDLKT